VTKLPGEIIAWEANLAVGKVTISSISKLTGFLWDTHVTGFGARKQTNGTFFYVRYRHAGQQVVRSIGRHGPWTPDTARAKAKQILGVVAGGTDPFAQTISGEGFGPAVDRYLSRKRALLRPGSFQEAERYLRNYSAPLHSLRLSQVDRRKIAALLGDVETSSGPATRNRMRSALSAFLAWCIAEGLVDVNPVTGTAKANEGASRERVLSTDELRQLWRGLGEDPFSEVVRLLLLTGQRRDEIGLLQWSEIDLVRKQIVFPTSRTKNGREHTLPLSSQAIAILERQPRLNSSEFVFGGRGFQAWSRDKSALDKKLGLAGWRLHDLRRTCATQMAELGVLPHIIEAILNHVSGHKAGVAGTYNRARYEPEMRLALQRWSDHVDQIVK
jgi:integrase